MEMKTFKKFFFSIGLTASTLLMIGCNEDTKEPEVSFSQPTIEVSTAGTSAATGETIPFTIKISAEAGLSSVKVGTQIIESFDGTTTTDEIIYNYLAETVGELTLLFTVEDAQSQTADASVVLTIEEGIDLGFLIFDFAGSSTGTEVWERENWDIRTIYSFGVTGSFITTSTVQSVNTQAQVSFAQANPSSSDDALVLKLEKIPAEGFDNWGGWSHVLFDLGQTLDKSMVDALPQWDAVNTQQSTGTKVFQVDAYYDDTVDPDFSWTSLTALSDIWNSVPAQGYKVDLTLGSYDSLAYGGHDGDGYFIEYEAYITAPNEWQTLTFSAVGTGRTGSFYPTKATSVASDKVDCIKFLPAGGYTGDDGNPVYFKNLRIVDVE
ncbi:MAG: hypothetical protein ACI8TA_002535 [Cyclobacteriaceae bacterium]|jgi:hypothetical protein